MDFVHYLILVAGGIGGGFINILIGGGGLIILPVYMGAGLSASMANGTNRVNLLMQYIIATIKFSRNGKMPWVMKINSDGSALAKALDDMNLYANTIYKSGVVELTAETAND